MDIILHLGAHRTGSTTWRSYLKHHHADLVDQGIDYWGPYRTRRGLFSGIQPSNKISIGRTAQAHTCARSQGRVRMLLDKAAKNGVNTLVISDENMLGSVRSNLRVRSLYPAAGERLARFAPAFEGRDVRVVFNVRSQDAYWASCAAYGVARGHPMLRTRAFDAMTQNRRAWRDVIADIACALPNTKITVLPYERFAGRPDAMLRCATGCDAPADTQREWLNKAPDARQLRAILAERSIKAPELDGVEGRWHPFTPQQQAVLREDYADDMFWLASGADGIATLTEDKDHTRAGPILPRGPNHKGHGYEFQERHMAQPG